jgi:hypothetical protein
MSAMKECMPRAKAGDHLFAVIYDPGRVEAEEFLYALRTKFPPRPGLPDLL